jgi:hypothetical protein
MATFQQTHQAFNPDKKTQQHFVNPEDNMYVYQSLRCSNISNTDKKQKISVTYLTPCQTLESYN